MIATRSDAATCRRLRDAGAVLLGKLNLHEMAYGASGVIGHFPVTRNPRNPAHITGGSSSRSIRPTWRSDQNPIAATMELPGY